MEYTSEHCRKKKKNQHSNSLHVASHTIHYSLRRQSRFGDYRQSFPFIFPIHPRPFPSPPSTFPPFSKSRISVSDTAPPFSGTNGVLGGALPAGRLPAMTPERLRRSTSLLGLGPGERPVRRREARLMDSRRRHWRFFARMKRVMLRTVVRGGVSRLCFFW